MNDKVEVSTDWMNLDEVSVYTRIRKSTIYKYTSNRNMPFFKVGVSLKFNRKSVDEWLEGKRVFTENEYKQQLSAKAARGGKK